MNQILITEKLYITPELKRQKKLYKIDFIISVFLLCLLFSYYIYAEYDKYADERKSQEILASMQVPDSAQETYVYDDTTVKVEDNEKIVVILNDEDGNEVKFEFLDLVELDDEEYVVLLPVAEEGEEEDGEVVILKLEDTDEDSDEESYVGVEDEETLNKVFEIFKEKYKDEFNFVDED
mgnify:CR=1 FL=1